MTTVVVPFRGSDSKRRLDSVPEPGRVLLAEAMLADVLDAALAVGRVLVVATEVPELPYGVELVPDPRRGQGAAVQAALEAAPLSPAGAYLVVNADLPCATARDLLALAGAIPEGGLALAVAADGTTNALGFADVSVFEPLYGPGSAERFAALAPSRVVDAPNLIDDVDTLDDLLRVAPRVGPHTARVLRALPPFFIDRGAAA
ncbi:MAG: NTP transferase domain-containing protein [Actinomycetota bacterium]|nr:NTP transferase domain-containing protein [Actinomycetota bacterium]